MTAVLGIDENAKLGAAYLVRGDRRFVPSTRSSVRKALLAGWNKALARAKRWEDA